VASKASESFQCVVDYHFARIPFFTKGGGSLWPFMRLDLEQEEFVFRQVRAQRWAGRPKRLRYEDVAEAQLHTEWVPWIRLHLADPSRGDIFVHTRNDGVIKLAERLEQHDVRVDG
jgi:hypothetical protein